MLFSTIHRSDQLFEELFAIPSGFFLYLNNRKSALNLEHWLNHLSWLLSTLKLDQV